jgi:hypothetical protein
MRTIEEHSSSSQGVSYNNMLSASAGGRKSGLVNSVSQAQYDLKQKHKVQTVVSQNSQAFVKRSNPTGSSALSSSASASNFRSPNQLAGKKGKYM